MNRIIPALALLGLLAGCQEKKPPRIELTPQQQAIRKCVDDISTKNISVFRAYHERELRLMNGYDSAALVEAVASRRQHEEETCIAIARCYGGDERFFNVSFMTCMGNK